MRLIDADKLRHELIMGHDLIGAKYTDMADTVEAITIEYIEEWHNKHEWMYNSYFTMREGKPKYAIECMIEDWRKEK